MSRYFYLCDWGTMKPEAVLKWFMQDLLPDIVRCGKFAEGNESQTLDKCEFEAIEKYISSFASSACFAKLSLEITETGSIATRDILVKFQSQDALLREKMRLVVQYENEITFYNKVYPSFVEFLKSCGKTPDFIKEIVPKCYFASNGHGDPEKAVVVLEDLRTFGFRLSDSPTDLDLKHCLISVEKLARFHSVSFAMKFKGWEPFEMFKSSFVDVWLEDHPLTRQQNEEFLSHVVNRGLDYLSARENPEVSKEYLENLKRMLKSISELQKSLRSSREPLSVLLHGDFNRNNILYRYSGGEPVDARLIDFQRVGYGSPSLDLGFLIYMNMSLAFREQHFERVFEHYHRCLVRNVATILNESENSIAVRLPIQAFREDFGRVALSHYLIVSFFLPLMMSPYDDEFESDMKYKTFRQMAEKTCRKGGDVVSERIAEVIVDFYRRKFYT